MPDQTARPDQDHGLRPQTDEFDCLGARVRIIDPAGILRAAAGAEIELLHRANFPTPVRRVSLRVATAIGEDGPAYRFAATIRRGGLGLPDNLDAMRIGLTGPVGLLLARQLTSRDPIQLATSVGLLAHETIRQLGQRTGGPTSGTRVLVDADTGLQATVTYDRVARSGTDDSVREGVAARAGGLVKESVVEIAASVPRRTVEGDTAYLRGFVSLVFQVIQETAGESGTPRLRGRDYVLSQRRQPPDVDSSDAVTLDQVGGLDHIVAQLREVAVSFNHPEAMARWGARRPQGILLYGPPGTGKTMLAMALANEIGARFREIRTPEILDKWLGGSERNIKRIFGEARRYREPTVMLFDEFDSIISYTGAGNDAASQAVNSVAGIFKQEMNTLIEDNPLVIVVATTNFPERVDDSLIRSGRFDIKMAVPQPDESGRVEIIAKMIRQLIVRHERDGFRMFAEDVDPHALAVACPGMTGADIKEALRRTQLAKAMEEARGGDRPAPIDQADILRALLALHT